MASISARENKNGETVWLAQIRRSGQPTISKTFKSRSLADQFVDRHEAELAEAARRSASTQWQSFYKEKFKHAITLFLKDSPDSAKYEFVLRKVAPNFPDVTFADLRPSVVISYIEKMLCTKTHMGRFYKPNTLATHLAAMSAVFKWRALQYDIDVKPTVFNRAHLPKDYDDKRTRRLSKEEEIRLMRAFRRRKERGYLWRLMIKLALETGARQQELFRAKWEDFDLTTGCWTIPKKNTKCKVERSVPLTKRARRALRALKMLKTDGQTGPFEGLTSLPNVRSMFRDFTAEAQIKDFRFHDLRHEAISRLVMTKRKLAVFEIMKFVGHSSVEMLSRYANLRGEELADRMD